MKIGILQTGHAPDMLQWQHGDYADMFEKLLDGHGFEFEAYDVVDMEFPKDVKEADGWLLTGSRHGSYEDHPFIAPLEEFVRKAYAEKVPMVGICFGHQIIAQALGGKVEKFSGGWSVGRQTYKFGDEELALNAWHQDQVTKLPEGAEVVASSEFCENAAMVYDNRAFTVQAHPEYGHDFIGGLIETRGRGVVPDPLLADAQSHMGAPIANSTIADRMAAFFKQPRG